MQIFRNYFEEVGSDKGYYFGVVRVFWKKYFVVGYVLEAPQNKSQKLFWGVTLVILPRVARMEFGYLDVSNLQNKWIHFVGAGSSKLDTPQIGKFSYVFAHCS